MNRDLEICCEHVKKQMKPNSRAQTFHLCLDLVLYFFDMNKQQSFVCVTEAQWELAGEVTKPISETGSVHHFLPLA